MSHHGSGEIPGSDADIDPTSLGQYRQSEPPLPDSYDGECDEEVRPLVQDEADPAAAPDAETMSKGEPDNRRQTAVEKADDPDELPGALTPAQQPHQISPSTPQLVVPTSPREQAVAGPVDPPEGSVARHTAEEVGAERLPVAGRDAAAKEAPEEAPRAEVDSTGTAGDGDGGPEEGRATSDDAEKVDTENDQQQEGAQAVSDGDASAAPEADVRERNGNGRRNVTVINVGAEAIELGARVVDLGAYRNAVRGVPIADASGAEEDRDSASAGDEDLEAFGAYPKEVSDVANVYDVGGQPDVATFIYKYFERTGKMPHILPGLTGEAMLGDRVQPPQASDEVVEVRTTKTVVDFIKEEFPWDSFPREVQDLARWCSDAGNYDAAYEVAIYYELHGELPQVSSDGQPAIDLDLESCPPEVRELANWCSGQERYADADRVVVHWKLHGELLPIPSESEPEIRDNQGQAPNNDDQPKLF